MDKHLLTWPGQRLRTTPFQLGDDCRHTVLLDAHFYTDEEDDYEHFVVVELLPAAAKGGPAGQAAPQRRQLLRGRWSVTRYSSPSNMKLLTESHLIPLGGSHLSDGFTLLCRFIVDDDDEDYVSYYVISDKH
jgi:hypothetical protein